MYGSVQMKTYIARNYRNCRSYVAMEMPRALGPVYGIRNGRLGAILNKFESMIVYGIG